MEKSWLRHYDSGVPHTLRPYPERTLVDLVSDAAQQRPDHTALFFQGARLSTGEVDQLSNALAEALVALGVKKGDKVALILPNCPQWVIGQLGAWKAGAVVVPMSFLLAEPEVRRTLIDCEARVALVLTPFYAKVKAAQPGTPLRHVIATNIKEHLPPHLRLLFSLLREKNEGHRITLQAGDWWLGDLLKHHAGAARPSVALAPDDTALFIYSGGTTGTPKAAVGTHRALLMTALQLRAWFSVKVGDWNDVVIGNMPMFHAYGALCLAAAQVGHNPVALIPDPRDLDNLLGTIRKVRAAVLPGVPALFIGLLKHPKIRSGKADLSSLKLCFSGAAPLMMETKTRFEELTGARIIECYSLTEAMVAAVGTPVLGMYKPRSVGVPFPDVEVRITDADDGRGTLPAGEVGEILMRAPNLMRGYWKRPEESADIIRDGWLYTGDLGYLDEDGYLFIVDRKKDLIKPGGKQVWPREVEEALATHPAVAEVGVTGVPHARLGEAVKAWVVLRAGHEATVDELRAYCKQHLAGYKVPKQIEFCASLPKSGIGKLLRRELSRAEGSRLAAPTETALEVDDAERREPSPATRPSNPSGDRSAKDKRERGTLSSRVRTKGGPTKDTDQVSGREQVPQESTRLHYLDWLRVIAIVGVWAYHSARPFMLQDWLINNAQTSLTITFVFLIFLGTMGMPLFFMMAGVGCLFALHRRTGKQFAIERTKRLLVPFVIGCILLSPVQFYLEWVHKGWYQGSFLQFIPILVKDRLGMLMTKFSPSIFESLGSHLWFLGYLFTFSLIVLPLFLWLKTEPGRRVIDRLGKLGERRGGLMVFILPVAAVRMSLQPFFPGYTDWADYAYMLIYFVCGYLLFADERLVRAIRRDWQLALSVGILSTLAILVGLATAGQQCVEDPRSLGFYLGWGLVGANGWCWTLVALWLGMRFLDFRNHWLDRGQELIVPFYVFHQPPIVVLAFFVVQWSVGLPLKLAVIVLGSLVATLALCELLVQRVKPARALFGMKPSWRPRGT